MSLPDLIKQLAAKNKPLSQIESAKVISVDKDDNVCLVKLLDVDLDLTVKLKTVSGSAGALGLVIYPEINSLVSICMVDDDPENLRMLDCTKIESISLTLGSKINLQMDTDGAIALAYLQLTLGEGKNGGLIKIAPLIEKINKLEDKLNDVISKLISHKHAAAGTIPTPPLVIASLTKTQRKELENENAKH